MRYAVQTRSTEPHRTEACAMTEDTTRVSLAGSIRGATRHRGDAVPSLESSVEDATLIVDSIPGLVAGFTAGGELEFVNRPILDYFGKTLEELRYWGAGGTTHPEDLPRIAELFSRSIA